MAAEQQSGAEYSVSCAAFCERLSRVHSADLMYAGDQTGRAALEILWLKLSLLVDVIRAAQSPQFDLGACRVTLDPTAKHLPIAWAFRLSCDSSTPVATTTKSSADLGLFWLSMLLANPQQDAARIHAVVTEMVSACGANTDQLAKSIFSSPVFGAQQLTATATTGGHAAVPAGLWRDVVLTGVKLATGIPKFSYAAGDEVFSDAVHARRLADSVALQTRARQALFIDPPQMEKNLREVLLELIDDPHWLDALSTTPAVAAKPERARPMSEAPPPPAMPVAEEENAEATIIIKRGAHHPAAPTRTPAPTPPAGASAPSVTRPIAPPPPEEPENLEATIIISKDKKR